MIIRPLWRTFSNSALCLVKKGRNGGTLNKKGADDNSSRIHKALKVIENSILERNVTDGSRARIVGIATAQRPHFPGFYKALTLKDASVIAGVTNELQNNKTTISLFYSKSDDAPTEVINSTKDVHKVGILAQIHNVIPGPNGSLTVFLFPQKRVTIDELYAPLVDEDASKRDPAAVIESGTSLSYVTVSSFKDDDYDEESIRPLLKEVVSTLNTLANMNPLVRDQLNDFMRNLEGPKELERDPAKLADFVGAISDGEVEDMQEILQSSSIEHRLKAGLKLLKNEIWNAELQSEITQDVEKKLSDKDREAFLQERLKKIQKELGIESISAEKAVEKFRKKASELSMPEYAKKVFEDEVGKLSTLRPSAQEYNLTMNYLNWLTDIPWGKKSKENLDVLAAEKVLNEDHYGLKDVKERILEFIAVGKLRGSVEGKIVCLSGPPGVGKTSIGKSIARALNREFYRFSVGGLYDVAEIKGHRRTYVGALPGKLIQALKKAQTENPLILLDEVDKIGRGGHNGDPSSALLEVLDPEQNSSFLDHYMDVPIDLSKALFICTANSLDTIPGPLLDRMEVISLSGYVNEEKVAIARQYLIPAVLKDSGVKEEDISLNDDALNTLIQEYCRENGVRNLKKQLEKIVRKLALEIIEEKQSGPVEITRESLHKYVGSPVYSDANIYPELPPGVSIGLAFNALSGSSLFIESVLEAPWHEKSHPGFHRTGQLGDVMKESSSISYAFARHFLQTLPDSMNKQINKKFFDHALVHTHVPEGAIPKDGPSAGITICSSLLSLALNTPLPRDLAMTGEITLTGKVLKIGGLKEKIIAAKRMGINKIVMPSANAADFEDLDASVKSGIEPVFAKEYIDVFKHAFPSFKYN